MFVGIDVGGTNLKAGLVDETGRIVAAERRPLGTFQGPEAFAADLALLASAAAEKGGVAPQTLEYVGIGLPGSVRGGEVLYTTNIPMEHVDLEAMFRTHLDRPLILGNDADCAAVGEYFCGAGQGSENFVVITLGTGIGSGLILGGKLYTGMGSGGEAGHMVIRHGGELCPCGRKGCWERYASATALIRLTHEAMEAHPESLLHALAEKDGGVEGRTAFQAANQGDETALAVCRTYVEYLADGVISLINILQPEILALGGGVAAAPDALLLDPLREIVSGECFSRHGGKPTRIVKAELGNDAGILGAAFLGRAV